MMFIILSLSSFSNHVPPIFCLSLCLIYLSIWHKSTKNKTKYYPPRQPFFIKYSPPRQRDFSLFTLHSSLFTLHFSLFTKRNVTHILHSSFKNRVSAIFHFSLFTFHFSLKETVTPILHSSLKKITSNKLFSPFHRYNK